MVPNTRRRTRATVCNSRKRCKRMYVYASAERKRPAIQRAPEGNLLTGPDGIANGKATAGARFSSPGPRGSLFQGFLQPNAPRGIPMIMNGPLFRRVLMHPALEERNRSG